MNEKSVTREVALVRTSPMIMSEQETSLSLSELGNTSDLAQLGMKEARGRITPVNPGSDNEVAPT